MKTADKMFEELGYEIKEITWKEDGKKHYIEYHSSDTVVQFSLDTKHILITNILAVQELQAIYKKCEELRMGKIINKIFKRKDKKLNQYPCNIFLQNALELITVKEYAMAYSEICWAIIKSGGKLTEEQEKIFKNINTP